MIAMPHMGRREVFIGKDARRTALDYAEAIEYLCDEISPEVEEITLVQDNLNTHGEASLYKRFAPEKAPAAGGEDQLQLYPKTRQLAEHRGDRNVLAITKRTWKANRWAARIPGHRRRKHRTAEPIAYSGSLAIQVRRRSDKVEEILPGITASLDQCEH